MLTWFNIFSILFLIITACTSDEGRVDPESLDTSQPTHVKETQDAWQLNKQVIQGNAQGTTYTIKTSDDSLFLSPDEASAFFHAFDQELSTYIDSSLISRFNNSELDSLDLNKTRYFRRSYTISKEVTEKTKGAFDPTVLPFVKAWGFFKNPQDQPDNKTIDSIRAFVGFLNQDLISLTQSGNVIKKDMRLALDFNAIAQGQSVDEIAEILEGKGQENFYIEVGGEIRTKGVNDRGTPWVIGIDAPKVENDGVTQKRELENYLSLTNCAVATSGNYRKFYMKNGEKYSHTIDPKTGKPVQHNLLSTTVIGDDAATCDAYATAFMTMGVDKTLAFLNSDIAPDIEVYMLFENKAGRLERAYSKGMENFFLKSE